MMGAVLLIGLPVELDALPPVELRRRIEEAVKSHIDDDLWTEYSSPPGRDPAPEK